MNGPGPSRASALAIYPLLPAAVPAWEDRAGRYEVGFARSRGELDEVLRLRFSVFQRELGHGSAAPHSPRDEDEFDAHCHHLVVRCKRSGDVVGTYRLMTDDLARRGPGFYSSQEFRIQELPTAVLREGLELGRACIARAHRGRSVLFLLWRGIGAYLHHNGKRYLFGCTSLPTLDAERSIRVADSLRVSGHWSSSLRVTATPAYAKPPTPATQNHGGDEPDGLPQLMRSYLNLGAEICGGPAYDAAFGTTDFFMLLDASGVAPKTYRRYVD